MSQNRTAPKPTGRTKPPTGRTSAAEPGPATIRLEADALHVKARLLRQSETCVLLWESRQSGRGRGSVTIRHWSIATSLSQVMDVIAADDRLYARRDAYERFAVQAKLLLAEAAEGRRASTGHR